MATTNTEFARKVGVHFTMASRMRNGQRLPSVKTLTKISTEYEIPLATLIEAYGAGAGSFSALLRDRVFEAA